MMLVEVLTSTFILVGGFFSLVGSIGLAKLPDFFMRLHGPTKSTTLGVGSILIASAIHFSAGDGTSLHELLVTLFLFITAPISAHLLARAALHLQVRSVAEQDTRRDCE